MPFNSYDDDVIEETSEPAGEPDWDALSPERRAFISFTELTKEKRRLEQELDQIKERIDALSYQLRTYLEGETGYRHISINGFTIFVRREVHARKFENVSPRDLIRALKAAGLGHFIYDRVNDKGLSSHVRGLLDQYADELAKGALQASDLLPPELRGLLNVEPSYKVIAQQRG